METLNTENTEIENILLKPNIEMSFSSLCYIRCL